MDSQGFVFLSVIANFNRIRQLTQDMELIKLVCFNSPNIQIRTAGDGVDRLRKRDGWQQWVLAMEERDPSVQNDGPAQLQQPRLPQPPMFGVPYAYDGVAESAMPYNASPSMMDDGLLKHRDGYVQSLGSNEPTSTTNESISGTSVTQTPLSAAVPDFAPGLLPTDSRGLSPIDSNRQNANLFTDAEVDNLMIIVRKPQNASRQYHLLSCPLHLAHFQMDLLMDGPSTMSLLNLRNAVRAQLSTGLDHLIGKTAVRAARTS